MSSGSDNVASLRLQLLDEFSATTKKFVDGMSAVDSAGKKAEGATKAASTGLKGMAEGFSMATIKAGVFAAGVMAAGYAAKKLADGVVGMFRPFVEAGAQMEGFKVRLTAMTGSVKEGGDLLAYMTKEAEKVPASLEEVVQAGVSLKSFGADVRQTLTPVADLAGFMGVTLPEAAMAFGKAFAGGAGAADIFRERGVMNIIKMKTGIEDLTKLSLPEFRAAMMSTFTEVGGGIAGMADEMSKTWEGALSNIGDKFGGFKRDVADVIFPKIKAAANAVLDQLNQFSDSGKMKAWAKEVGDALLKMFDGLLAAAPMAVTALGFVVDVGWSVAKVGTAAALAWNSLAVAAAAARVGVGLGLNDENNAALDRLLTKERELAASVVAITEAQEGWKKGVVATEEQVRKLAATLKAVKVGPEKTEEEKSSTKKSGAATVKEATKEEIKALEEKRKAYNKYFEEVFRQNKLAFDQTRALSVAAGLAGEADLEAERFAAKTRREMVKEALQHKVKLNEIAYKEIASKYDGLKSRLSVVLDAMKSNWEAYTAKIKSINQELADMTARAAERQINQKDRFGEDRFDEEEKTVLRMIRYQEMLTEAYAATGEEQNRLLREALRYREDIANTGFSSGAIRRVESATGKESGLSATSARQMQADLDDAIENARQELIALQQAIEEARAADNSTKSELVRGMATELKAAKAEMDGIDAAIKAINLTLAGTEAEREIIVKTDAAKVGLTSFLSFLKLEYPADGIKSHLDLSIIDAKEKTKEITGALTKKYELDIDTGVAMEAIRRLNKAIEDLFQHAEETNTVLLTAVPYKSKDVFVDDNQDARVPSAWRNPSWYNPSTRASHQLPEGHGGGAVYDARAVNRAQTVNFNITAAGTSAKDLDAELAELYRRKSSKLRKAMVAA